MRQTPFRALQYEWTAYLDGKLVVQEYAPTPARIREKLRYLVRKHNKPVVYQIIKLSHRYGRVERRSWETGAVSVDLTFHRTSTHRNTEPKNGRNGDKSPGGRT